MIGVLLVAIAIVLGVETKSLLIGEGANPADHDRIVELAEKHFASVPRTPANAQIAQPLTYLGGDGRESRTLEQAHLVLGCEGIGYRDPDYYASAIYSTLFGGGPAVAANPAAEADKGK